MIGNQGKYRQPLLGSLWVTGKSSPTLVFVHQYPGWVREFIGPNSLVVLVEHVLSPDPPPNVSLYLTWMKILIPSGATALVPLDQWYIDFSPVSTEESYSSQGET